MKLHSCMNGSTCIADVTYSIKVYLKCCYNRYYSMFLLSLLRAVQLCRIGSVHPSAHLVAPALLSETMEETLFTKLNLCILRERTESERIVFFTLCVISLPVFNHPVYVV